MVSRSALVRVAVVAFGVLLIGLVGFQLVQPGYTHHVEHLSSERSVPSGATPLQYENLSTEGQDVIQAAFRSPDDTATVGAEERPPDFDYGDRRIDHYVVFHGEYYRVTTGDRGVLSAVNGIFAYLLLALGAVAILTAGLGLYRQYADADSRGGPGAGS